MKTTVGIILLSSILSTTNTLAAFSQAIRTQEDYNLYCSQEAYYYKIQSPECSKGNPVNIQNVAPNRATNPVTNPTSNPVANPTTSSVDRPATANPVKNPAPGEISSVFIPDGTEIIVSTIEKISSKDYATGALVNLKVDSDLVINGKVVVKAGTIARATITESKKSGFLGKSGRLNVAIDSTTSVDGQKINLRGSVSGNGNGQVGTTVAVSLLVSPLGLLIKGGNAKIMPGTPIKAYVNGQHTVSVQ